MADAMRKLGYRTGGHTRLNHSAAGLGRLARRRIGRARSFDVWDNATGELVIRNVDAQAAATYATSLNAEQVIEGVATQHFIDSDGFRITAHMAIGT
jgi:hypothetical protein